MVKQKNLEIYFVSKTKPKKMSKETLGVIKFAQQSCTYKHATLNLCFLLILCITELLAIVARQTSYILDIY